MSLFLLAGFFVFSFFGIPLAISLGLSTALTFFIYNLPLAVIPRLMYTATNSFLLVAVPLFILAGSVMEKGGVSDKIFDAANSVVGRIKGGLGHVNIIASFIFGGISGSSVADIGSLGPLEINAMTSQGFPKGYSASLTMVTSTLSSLVPPSILMIIAAVSGEVSVGSALAGGFAPAVTLVLSFMIYNYWVSSKYNYGKATNMSFKKILKINLEATPALLSPIIILTGMFSGIVTPTEAAALSVIYTLFISIFVYRKMSFKDFPKMIINAGRTAGTILLIVMTSSVATYVFVSDQLPEKITNFLLGLSGNPQIILLLMAVIFIILGMFMDLTAAILLVTPILMPTALKVGINPIHFIVFEVYGLCIGLSTPPVGVCLFATSLVSGLKIEDIVKPSIPFYIIMIVVLIIIALIPDWTLLFVNLLT